MASGGFAVGCGPCGGAGSLGGYAAGQNGHVGGLWRAGGGDSSGHICAGFDGAQRGTKLDRCRGWIFCVGICKSGFDSGYVICRAKAGSRIELASHVGRHDAYLAGVLDGIRFFA